MTTLVIFWKDNIYFICLQQKKLEALAKKRLTEDFFDDLPESVPKSIVLKRKAAKEEENKQEKNSDGKVLFLWYWHSPVFHEIPPVFIHIFDIKLCLK